MNTSEKKIEIHKNENGVHKIVVTHLTIRQSMFFLVLKLILIEIIAASGMVFYYFLNTNQNTTLIKEGINYFNPIPFFIFLVILKLLITIFVCLEWLEEYYEILPNEIVHKKGFIFRKEETNKIEHLAQLKIRQGFLGRVFNYGTLSLYNWTTEKDVTLFLIHNPKKYHKVLDSLLPAVDRAKDIFRENVVDEDE